MSAALIDMSRWSSHRTFTEFNGPAAADSQPRFPGALLPGTCDSGENVRPPSVDRAETSRVPAAALDVQMTTTPGSAPRFSSRTTRGGCSPPTCAEPAILLTRTGSVNV